MRQQELETLELQLADASRSLIYPPTPDLARLVMQRMEAIPSRRRATVHWGKRTPLTYAVYALAVLLVMLAGLLSVPAVRAQILEFIQIGVVRIFTGAPTPTITATPPPATTPPPAFIAPQGDVIPTPTRRPSPTPFPTSTTRPTPTPIGSLLELDGLTSLEQAVEGADFTVRIPEYPSGLGQPDRVYFQDLGGQMLVLVWLDPDDSNEINLSLHEYYGEDQLIIIKKLVEVIEETEVNGQWAIWAEGPYYLKLRNGQVELVRLIEGHVLIWEDEGVTYRLESNLTMEEAVRIAESLQPVE